MADSTERSTDEVCNRFCEHESCSIPAHEWRKINYLDDFVRVNSTKETSVSCSGFRVLSPVVRHSVVKVHKYTV